MNELQNLLTSAKDADKLISVGAYSLEQLRNGIIVILIWFAVIFLLTYTVPKQKTTSLKHQAKAK